MKADKLIADTAAAQHGLVTRRQLSAAGVPGHVVDYRLRAGLLIGVHPGVYRLSASTRTWEQRILAATLVAGPGAVASHRAAGFLLRLDGVEPRPEVTVARARAPRPPGVLVHRSLDLRAADVEERDGIPRTRVGPTLLGLAAVLTAPAAEAALDDALGRGLVSCAQLRRQLDRTGRQGRAGAATLGALLAQRDGPRWTQSELERRLLRLVVAAGLPPPVPQYEVRLADGGRAFLDFAWPDRRIAVEGDSYRHHGGRLAWSRDHTRNAQVVAAGWRILPVTWDDLVSRPDALMALLRRVRAA